MPPTDPFILNEQKLAQSALAKVRGVMKGNGLKQDRIEILSHKIVRHTLNAGTYLELKPVLAERNVPGRITAGQLTRSREEAMRGVDQAMRQAAVDANIKAQIANVLLSRSDQGFGLSRQAIPLDFLKREYCWHDACHTCRGTAQAPCQRCQGRKLETCIKCTGRGLMPCPICRATGLVQGEKCHRCHAQRYVPCDGCNRSGMMGCRMCNATGVSQCPTCAGQGWKTYIVSLAAQAVTYFEYDAKSIPKGAADAVETMAQQLAATSKIKITGRVADEKENVLGANYEVEFPYGEINFKLGAKEAKAKLFGFSGDLVEFPNVLDKMLGPSVAELEEAANNVGSVAAAIQKATRFRLIAQAFLTQQKTTTKKTIAQLMKTYDIGLSLGMAEKIAILADRTTAKITRKPRYYGLGVGLAITAVLCALYYLVPLRPALAAYLPDPRFDAVLDLIVAAAGAVITTLSIQLVAAGAVRKALGHLLPKNAKNSLIPKAQETRLWGYGGVVAIIFVMIELGARLGSGAPYWYELLRSLIVRAI